MRIATANLGAGLETVLLQEDGSAHVLGMPIAELIGKGPAALDRLRTSGGLPLLAPGEFTLAAPIPAPAKNVFCVGRNYMEHIAEGDRAQKQEVGVTQVPVFFTKPPTAVTAPDGEVPIFPHLSTHIDYEVELAVVIGKPGRDIPRERAMEHVFGYTIINDVTARDIQRKHGGQYFKGKGLDGSCPMGPWIVTADAIADPHDLGIRCLVNGELRQDGNTRDMVFDIPTLIAALSAGMTLEPGDILATGTPSGVGYAMEPPQYLRDGDIVTCEIDGIGRLTNRMRAMGSAAKRVA
ncbi:2-keto-4-pentenoate hydratase/2-oxohepta-3-ene-1,7-dioic acid hydratase in catechol pathway [Limimaricola variabilis]|uniref:2-keto-4-pentenoate hydratase/2-oxohepta-3-ene-1,7-dioic acid hydratase in catechol pathway n=1 Tax=Limimaricola variabilis TaxID=1492771 RepID=A0ABR6HN46_9RHOB|nr:fumarylacetoacetate hydrolase family protein [Limimaricola variabilis]MBB3711977.1 2-keto-4-pentenoate hydratase/2-oxohepta-3-ene-1,7-dioic acid hydratase in catechol pathway [Limimaricola variabilis]